MKRGIISVGKQDLVILFLRARSNPLFYDHTKMQLLSLTLIKQLKI